MVARMGQREEGLTVWIRQAQADGRLKAVEPAFAAQQMHGLIKTFAFWPQISIGKPCLTREEQVQVVESALDMFLARYQVCVSLPPQTRYTGKALCGEQAAQQVQI